MNISAILHKPPLFSSRSGMHPLAEKLGAYSVFYDEFYRSVMNYSWRAGQTLREWGILYYGSTWNSLLPYWDEWRMARQLPEHSDVLHFLWGEFASPRRSALFRKRADRLIGTFHASARRLPSVLGAFKCLGFYDGITLMSSSQLEFFVNAGFPVDRIRTILHGVDLDHFRPTERRSLRDGVLRGLMVGSTERDHAMMRSILDKLPDGILELTVLTADELRQHYYQGDIKSVNFPGKLSDIELLKAYQEADLLVMPMLDCTANNAVLESMACGTPVMVNRVGGIPEYVDSTCNVILDEHTVDAWVDRLMYWRNNRDKLEAMRTGARAWAEEFDWGEKAREYIAFYGELI